MLLLLSACGRNQSRSVENAVATNPLTYTDIPDNDVIRVGEDYYMVSTTMYFCPGAPIMHSRDLVHWRIVNYVYDTLADDDVYNLRNGRNAYGMGQWATTLREKDGTFYALFIANDQHKTFVYTTTDIQHGPWKRHAVYDRPFHDAGLIFDDGRAFVVWGQNDIQITELEPDLSAIKEGGVDRLLIRPSSVPGMSAEGTHMYHIGDYYYALTIGWPRGEVRTESCWRSRELLGDYERRVVLRGTIGGLDLDGVAQGAMVDTPNGDWYAIMFQDHGAVGRIPTLQPVHWEDGWPLMGDKNGCPLESFVTTLPEDPAGDYVWASDEFDVHPSNPVAQPQPFLTEGEAFLSPVWQWNHMPVEGAWSLTEREGFLRLHTATVTDDILTARGTLTQRTVGPRCIAEVHLDASGMLTGDCAGICAFQSNYATIGVEVNGMNERFVTCVVRQPASRSGAEKKQRTVLDRMPGNDLYLRFWYNFTPQEDIQFAGDEEADNLHMAYSYNGTQWTMPPVSLSMRYTTDLFTGYRTALYSYATQELGGYADFDFFHQWVY